MSQKVLRRYCFTAMIGQKPTTHGTTHGLRVLTTSNPQVLRGLLKRRRACPDNWIGWVMAMALKHGWNLWMCFLGWQP